MALMTLKDKRKKFVEEEAKKTALNVARKGFSRINERDNVILAQDINECLATKYGITYQEDDQGNLVYFYIGTDYEEAERRRVEICAMEMAQDVIENGYVIAKPRRKSRFSEQVNDMLKTMFHISKCSYDDEYDIYFLSSSNPEKIKKRAKEKMKETKKSILNILKNGEDGEDRLLMKILEMLSSETR